LLYRIFISYYFQQPFHCNVLYVYISMILSLSYLYIFSR
jgi:hypothetical protein